MASLKPYNWATDERAIRPVGEYHRICHKLRGICPQGHQCNRSRKLDFEKYFYCYKCENEVSNPLGFNSGIYYPEEVIKFN